MVWVRMRGKVRAALVAGGVTASTEVGRGEPSVVEPWQHQATVRHAVS